MNRNILIKSFDTLAYLDAISMMEQTVHNIINKTESEQVWFLEHDSVYTAGTSAKKEDLLFPQFPVIETSRGGQFTYHGPGQLIVYVMIHLQEKDIRAYIMKLASWIIETLQHFNIESFFDIDKTGVWVSTKNGPQKIAAFGVRVTKWVTWHGLSLNISTNLDHFTGIIPCGIKDCGITSFNDLGIKVDRQEIQEYMKNNIAYFF